jgi:integrase
MTYFMLFTGCRRGEAAALQQKHINREKKMATICQSIAYSNTRKPVIKPPKTEAGIREVDLYDNVLEILPEYDDPETYVFFPDGLPTKTALESGLKKYQTENGLTSTAHQLRHAYATMGHAAHIDPKDMQHRLGHSSIAMTMDIYTDLDNKYNSEVRNKFNDYIQNEVMKKTSCQRVVNETETD